MTSIVPRRDDVIVETDGTPSLLFASFLETLTSDVDGDDDFAEFIAQVQALIASARAEFLNRERTNIFPFPMGGNNEIDKRIDDLEILLSSVMVQRTAFQEIPANTVLNRIASFSAAATVKNRETLIFLDPAAATFTLTLPKAVENKGKEFRMKRIDSSVNSVTVAAQGAETIDNGATFSLATALVAVRIASDGSDWWIID